MKIFLVIIFFNTLNQPVYLDGWHPMEMESLEKCERAKKFAQNYLKSMLLDYQIENITGVEVTCKFSN